MISLIKFIRVFRRMVLPNLQKDLVEIVMNSRFKRILGLLSDSTHLCQCKNAACVCRRRKALFLWMCSLWLVWLQDTSFYFYCMVWNYGESQQWSPINKMTWHQCTILMWFSWGLCFFLETKWKENRLLLHFLNQRRSQLYWPARNLICKTKSIMCFRCPCGNSANSLQHLILIQKTCSFWFEFNPKLNHRESWGPELGIKCH